MLTKHNDGDVSVFDKAGAERMAQEIANLVHQKRISSRHPAADAMQDYMGERGIPRPTVGESLFPPPGPSKEAVWAIFYEDADKTPEVFCEAGSEQAARGRYEQLRGSWNCWLMAEFPGYLEAAQIERDAALSHLEAVSQVLNHSPVSARPVSHTARLLVERVEAAERAISDQDFAATLSEDEEQQFFVSCGVPDCPTHGKKCAAFAYPWILDRIKQGGDHLTSLRQHIAKALCPMCAMGKPHDKGSGISGYWHGDTMREPSEHGSWPFPCKAASVLRAIDGFQQIRENKG